LRSADGNADFAKKIGLVKETGPFGGTRRHVLCFCSLPLLFSACAVFAYPQRFSASSHCSARYALIATNGVVDHIDVDEQGVEKTTADALLAHL